MDSIRQSPRAEIRVLVVDDEATVRRALAHTLRTRGHIVTEARSGHEALALLRAAGGHELGEAPFDVIVSDISMPDGDGVQLLRAVREIDLDVPFILVTGAPDLRSATEAVGLGAFKYLIKPVEPDLMRATVARAFDLHRLARLKRDALALVGESGAADRAGLEVVFERALEHLWIAYQPLVRADGRVLYGYEALVRSREPAFPNPPALFDAAKRLGMCHEIARRIRTLAAAPFVSHDAGEVVFVNVNPGDLLDESFYDPAAPLSTIAPRVVLEITERASLDAVPDLRERVARLRALGYRIALDDLGAGYAGLSSFALLEPELVKIDMGLVRDVDRTPTKRRLIRAMSSLCKDMGMLVVAEGVETVAERDVVSELGCELLQGYLFARPGAPFPAWTWGGEG